MGAGNGPPSPPPSQNKILAQKSASITGGQVSRH